MTLLSPTMTLILFVALLCVIRMFHGGSRGRRPFGVGAMLFFAILFMLVFHQAPFYRSWHVTAARNEQKVALAQAKQARAVARAQAEQARAQAGATENASEGEESVVRQNSAFGGEQASASEQATPQVIVSVPPASGSSSRYFELKTGEKIYLEKGQFILYDQQLQELRVKDRDGHHTAGKYPISMVRLPMHAPFRYVNDGPNDIVGARPATRTATTGMGVFSGPGFLFPFSTAFATALFSALFAGIVIKVIRRRRGLHGEVGARGWRGFRRAEAPPLAPESGAGDGGGDDGLDGLISGLDRMQQRIDNLETILTDGRR